MADRRHEIEIVAFLGSTWASLEHHNSRWRALVTRWAPLVDRLVVVDFPKFDPKGIASPLSALVVDAESWWPDVRSLRAAVPLVRSIGAVDRFAWRRVSRALDVCLGRPRRPRVVVAATPLWAPVLPRLSRDLAAFDAVDDWRDYAATRRVGRIIEDGYRALRQVDVITANSDEIARRLSREYGVASKVFPNSVDVKAYLTPRVPPSDLPPDYVVYVGVLEDRVNLDLLIELSKRMTDVPVVVGGPATPAVAARIRSSPLHWLGPVRTSDVPALLGGARVGLLPHHVNAFTTSMSPMKLLEYLAAGLPVVATPLPGISDLSSRVVVADDAPGFEAAIRRCFELPRLAAPDPAVAGLDWDQVATPMLELYRDRLTARQKAP